ncbi:MAG: FAD-dependent oxidoreductase [Candidatus Bathyarchaeota archaeon]|nr:FAD-dependent oxidoreductase [Candidatus Bathyarchaeota archaeon]
MKIETAVKEIIPRTTDMVSYRFPRPKQLNYKPGQYMLATIKASGKELTHPFSFSSSPTEKDFIEFTKKLTDSEYSNTLRTLKPGDWARIDAPYGTFTFQGEHQKIAMLAGGVGITPFRSICRYATDTHLNSSIILLYGCRNENEIAFKAELEEMQRQNPNLKVVFILGDASNQWKGLVGFINAELVKTQVPDYKERVFYACGPPGMVKAMKNLITSIGLPLKQLKLEVLAGHT